jgi:hypothetical protein
MAKHELAERNGKVNAVVPTMLEERVVHGTVEEANEQRPARRPRWRLDGAGPALG